MDIQLIIDGLKSHNAWRRGEKPYEADDWSPPFPPPHSGKQLGELLDAAVKALEDAQAQHQTTWHMAIEAAADYVETYDGSKLADGIRALSPKTVCGGGNNG